MAVRTPKWTPKQSIRVLVEGAEVKPVFTGAYTWLPRVQADGTVILRYDLPPRVTKETALGKEHTLRWRGDGVVGVSPNTDFYPLYPTGEQ